MQADEQASREQALLACFDLSEASFPFTDTVVDAIISRRAQMKDTSLFIDELLPEAVDENQEHLYPPTDVDGFRALLAVVEQLPQPQMQKDSIPLYFFCQWHAAAAMNPGGFADNGMSLAESDQELRKFTKARNIQPHYANVIRAYYLLDSGAYEPAITLLSDPRIIADWSSKVLSTLAAAGLDNTASLVLRYVRSAKVKISEDEDIAIYLGALARVNLMDAWLYQRSFPTDIARKAAVQLILNVCLIPGHRPEQLKQLAAFPLDALEEETLTSYAAAVDGDHRDDLPLQSLAVLRQLLLMRLIQSGRYTDALKLDRAMPVPDGDETRIRERRTLMRHVLGLVPPVQRAQLEREYSTGFSASSSSFSNSHQRTSSSGSFANAGASSPMSMSWEDLAASRQRAAPQEGTPAGRRVSSASFGTPLARATGGAESPRPRPGVSQTTPSGARSVLSSLKTATRLPRDVQPLYSPSPAAAFMPLRASGTVTPSKRPLPESPTIGAVATNNKDVDMVDSDDPDAFVIRPMQPTLPVRSKPNGRPASARSSISEHPRKPAFAPTASHDDPMDTEMTILGAFPNSEEHHVEPSTSHGALPGSEEHHVEPSISHDRKVKRQRQMEDFEITPVALQQSPRKPPSRVSRSKASDPPKPAAKPVSSSSQRSTRNSGGRRSRMSIPGTFEHGETSDSADDTERDEVPALPPTRRAARRSRAESSEPESGPIRRSTRLSTTSAAELVTSPTSAAVAPPTTKKGSSRRKAADPAAGSSRMATRRSKPNVLDDMDE
ncbi:nuclear pore complex assembly-domain-containing protein [Auriculariales sp. MPI-PUGE-AT-0066]|nr:nuclear pore complex assembly-domain-containing protein [Auriculariales sp. MPI-PUGE-AT-0066]